MRSRKCDKLEFTNQTVPNYRKLSKNNSKKKPNQKNYTDSRKLRNCLLSEQTTPQLYPQFVI